MSSAASEQGFVTREELRRVVKTMQVEARWRHRLYMTKFKTGKEAVAMALQAKDKGQSNIALYVGLAFSILIGLVSAAVAIASLAGKV